MIHYSLNSPVCSCANEILVIALRRAKCTEFPPRMKHWEIIADNLSKAGWNLGWVSALDLQGRTIWIVDAHGYGKRFIVRADEKLTAFLELESAILSGRTSKGLAERVK